MWIILRDDFWRDSVFSSCWFDSGYMICQSTETPGFHEPASCPCCRWQFCRLLRGSCHEAQFLVVIVDAATLCLLPFCVVRPMMLGIMAVLDQKDSSAVIQATHAVGIGSGMCKPAFGYFFAICSLLFSSGPRCSTPWPVWTRRAAMQRLFGGCLYGFVLWFWWFLLHVLRRVGHLRTFLFSGFLRLLPVMGAITLVPLRAHPCPLVWTVSAAAMVSPMPWQVWARIAVLVVIVTCRAEVDFLRVLRLPRGTLHVLCASSPFTTIFHMSPIL